MQKNSGMMLIELLIYLTLFAFIAMASISSAVRFLQTSQKYEKKHVSLMNITAAHDLLLYDLEHAPSLLKDWKVQEPCCLIWKQKDTDIGWLYEQNTLFRIEGMYKVKQKKWQKKSKNIVAPHMDHVMFKCHGQQEITHITFSLIDAYHAIDAQAILLSRTILWHKDMDQPQS